jgi:hypothetical protein
MIRASIEHPIPAQLLLEYPGSGESFSQPYALFTMMVAHVQLKVVLAVEKLVAQRTHNVVVAATLLAMATEACGVSVLSPTPLTLMVHYRQWEQAQLHCKASYTAFKAHANKKIMYMHIQWTQCSTQFGTHTHTHTHTHTQNKILKNL